MFLLRDKLITQGEIRGTSTQNLLGNSVAQQVEAFLFLVFRRLKLKTFAPQTPFSIHSPHARNGEICREKMFVASACSR